jgi:hypothetical protein
VTHSKHIATPIKLYNKWFTLNTSSFNLSKTCIHTHEHMQENTSKKFILYIAATAKFTAFSSLAA